MRLTKLIGLFLSIIFLQSCIDSNSMPSSPPQSTPNTQSSNNNQEKSSPSIVSSSMVSDAQNASASDVITAEDFLKKLPSACSSSFAYASTDGTVNIRILCSGNGESTDGLVSVKNNVITQLK